MKAYISPEEEGTLVIALKGTDENILAAIRELKNMNVKVEAIESDIKIIKEKCTDCSVCISICPTGALWMDKEWTVYFDTEKCIACELCIKACPTKAIVSTI